MFERRDLLRLWTILQTTTMADHLVLVGSAAIFLHSSTIPPLTHDADFIVREADFQRRSAAWLQELAGAGFLHLQGTATFTHPDGFSFDLLGIGDHPGPDRLGGAPGAPLLVFSELTQLGNAESGLDRREGIPCLSPPALMLSKLLTVRLDKGPKDKLQALALAAELGFKEGFRERFIHLAKGFGKEALEDAVADCQAAFASLTMGREAEGAPYAAFLDQVTLGLEWLMGVAESWA